MPNSKQHGHHDHHVAFQVAQVEAADEHQELAGDAEENAHVQQPAEHDHHSGRPADARAKAFFEQLGDGHHSGIAERIDAEAGAAHEKHGQGHEHARHSPRKSVLVAIFRRIHAGDDAKLGGRQRGDAQVHVHLAAGHQKMLDLAHVAADHDAGDHRGHQVQAHNAAVDRPGEVRHRVLLTLPAADRMNQFSASTGTRKARSQTAAAAPIIAALLPSVPRSIRTARPPS